MTDVMTYSFGETDKPPPERRKGGPGRQRQNIFDGPVRQSYEDGWYLLTDERPEGRWHVFKVEASQRDKVYNQIRNAGSYQNLGTNIRVSENPDADGMITVAFRGKPPDDRGSKSKEDVENESSGNETEPTYE